MQPFAFVGWLCLCESGCLPTRWGRPPGQKRYLQLIGGTETGKAQLAITLGRNAVRGCGIVDLVNPLEQEKAADKARQLANRLVVVVK